MPFPDIFLTPSERLRAEKSRQQMTPQPTRFFFGQEEIEKYPQLQRMRVKPFEVPMMRENIQRKKIQELYQKVLPSIDEMPVADNMKELLKASLITAGPKVALDYLEAMKNNDTKMAIQILKSASQQAKQTGGQYEVPQTTGGGGFPRGTVTQKGPKGKVSVLHAPKQPTPKAAPVREDIADQLRQWVGAQRQIEQGAVSNELIAVLGAMNPKIIGAYAEATRTEDDSGLKQITQEQIQILQQKLEEFDIKEEFPNAQEDEHGWYIVKDGKKYYIRRTE